MIGWILRPGIEIKSKWIVIIIIRPVIVAIAVSISTLVPIVLAIAIVAPVVGAISVAESFANRCTTDQKGSTSQKNHKCNSQSHLAVLFKALQLPHLYTFISVDTSHLISTLCRMAFCL